MKKVLLTGSRGFIGHILLQKLQSLNIEVIQLIRKETSEPHSIHLDLTEHWSINPCEGVDTVFHLAGKSHALAEILANKEDYFHINTDGTRKLLAAAQQAGVQRFIYFSSVKAMGDSEQIQDETSQLSANTAYGQSKQAAEQLVLKGGYVPYPVIIRPCMVYGFSTKGNLPKMIDAIARGFFPPLPEVNNQRSMVHVNDVVQAALLVVKHPHAAGKIYIVTENRHYSTRQLYELICHALHHPVSKLTLPLMLLNILAKLGDIIGFILKKRFIFDSDAQQKLLGSACYSSAKIEKELGFKARHSLSQTLPEIVQYLTFNHNKDG